MNDDMEQYRYKESTLSKYKKTFLTLAATVGLLAGGSSGNYIGGEKASEELDTAEAVADNLHEHNNDLENQIFHLSIDNDKLQQKLVALKHQQKFMKMMTTDEIIQQDIRNVLMAYGLSTILKTWAETQDAKERAALEKLMDVKFKFEDGFMQIMPINTNKVVKP